METEAQINQMMPLGGLSFNGGGSPTHLFRRKPKINQMMPLGGISFDEAKANPFYSGGSQTNPAKHTEGVERKRINEVY